MATEEKEKKVNAKTALAGKEKSEKSEKSEHSASKGSKSSKKAHGMHIRKLQGGFHVQHHDAKGMPMEGQEHMIPDMSALQSHIQDNMQGDGEPQQAQAAPPDAAPQAAPQGGAPQAI